MHWFLSTRIRLDKSLTSMAQGVMYFAYILYGCTFIGTILTHSVSSAVYERPVYELMTRQSLKCNNHCPYGFVADVEGEFTCTCYDPCSFTRCFSGHVCTVEMPKECEWGSCKPVTLCVAAVIKTRKGENFFPSVRDFPIPQQRDDPFIWDKLESDLGGYDVSACSEPLPPKALQCRQKQRRWFYNVMTGKCERYYGCSLNRNSFIRKRTCKDTCKGHIIPPEELRAIVSDDSACAQQPSYKDFLSCDAKHKRWFYNDKTGQCEKFTGCIQPGNNFSRKVFCKAKCRNMISKFRKSRTAESHLKASRST